MRLSAREHGFTVVEVIIAILLVTVVISGVTLALASGSRLETKRDTKSRMHAASERVYEHLRSDKDWVQGCRRSSPTSGPKTCNLMSFVDADLLEDDILGDSFSFSASASAKGIDNAGDGLGNQDMDGVVDDFFRIDISIDIPAAAKARIGAFEPLRVNSIINGSTNSNSGALIVSICSADNQIDERVQISGCNEGGVYWTEMPHCDSGPCAPWSISSLNVMSLTAPSRLLGLRPMSGVGFSISRIPEDGGPATVVPSSLAVPEGPGLYRFPDLPEGSWKINTPSVIAGRIDWPTHHVPSTKRATVEKRKTARALVMLQDPAASKPFQMTFDRVIRERWLNQHTKVIAGPWMPECEEPANAISGAFVQYSVYCNTATGHLVVTTKPGVQIIKQGETEFVSKYQSDGRFREVFTISYVSVDKKDQFTWPGAAEPATFMTAPTPAGRWTKKSSGAYTIPTAGWQVSVPEAPKYPNAGYKSTGAKASLSGMPAGLNEPLTMTTTSKIGNVKKDWKPAGCDERFIWVAAASNAITGSCSGVHMRGDDNECYTNLNAPAYGAKYYRDAQCGVLKWPPAGGSIPNPKGYLVTRICTQRISQVNNISDYSASDWNFTMFNYNGDRTEADYIAYFKDYGYTYNAGSVTIGGYTLGPKYFWQLDKPGDRQKIFDTGCRDFVSAPLDCPALDRWDNCSVSTKITIPYTPGWGTSGDIEDGHRPPTSGGSIAGMSP